MKVEVNQIAATLIINELMPRLNRKKIKIENSPITPAEIRTLACLKYGEAVTTKDIREHLDERLGLNN